MRIVFASALVGGLIVLSGCGQAAEIGGQAASAAASAAASEVGRQAGQAVEGAVGPICKALKRADSSMSTLAQGGDATVAEAKQQIAEAQADLNADGAAEAIASQAVLAGVSSALDGLAQTLAPLADDAPVPQQVVDAATSVTDAIDSAQSSLGC